MAEYIEREAFRDVLAKSHKSHAENYRDEVLLARDIRLLNEQPTADVVEVVRCKDCRHSEICPDTLLWCNKRESLTRENDFCSYGEKET